MRILRVNSWQGMRGGAEEYVRTVSRAMSATGHPTHVVSLTNEVPSDPKPDETYVRVPVLGARRAAADLFPRAEIRRELDAAVREFRPDLVHLHHYDAGFMAIARWISDLSIPVVMTAHDAELVCPNGSLMRPGNIVCEGGILPRCQFTGCEVGLGLPYELAQRASFDRLVARRIRAYFCPSRALTLYLHRNGYRPAVHLASYASIPDEIRAAPPPRPAPELPPTVGFLGRLEWYKGLDPLLRSIRLLTERIPNVRLDIAGDGPARPGAEALAARLGIADRVTFRGDRRGAAKEKWFRGIHVLALPSTWFENLAFVGMEAQARGCPVVASAVGGNAEVVHDGDGGRIVPVGDAPALAEALGQILSSPELARRMGERGRAWVLSEFTPERHIARLLAAYAAALHGQVRNSPVEAESLLARASVA